MEKVILDALNEAESGEHDLSSKEDLAKFVADELKRSICHQLMKQLDYL